MAGRRRHHGLRESRQEPLNPSAARIQFAALAVIELLGHECVELPKLRLEPRQVHWRPTALLLGPLHVFGQVSLRRLGALAPSISVLFRNCRKPHARHPTPSWLVTGTADPAPASIAGLLVKRFMATARPASTTRLWRPRWRTSAQVARSRSSSSAVLRAGERSRRRRSWALSATTTVEADMRIAPTLIGRTNPMGARTPAARGTEIRL